MALIHRLNSGFGCMSLRAGCLTIGWLLCITSLLHFTGVMEAYDGQMYMHPECKYGLEAEYILNLINAILLLVATYMREPDLLPPCIFLTIVEIAVFMIAIFALFFATGFVLIDSIKEQDNEEGEFGVIFFTIAAVLTVFASLKVHVFLVICSYYDVLKHCVGKKASTTV